MKSVYTYELDAGQQEKLLEIFATGNFAAREVPYSIAAVAGDGFNATLYSKEKHGKRKLCIQGAKAEEFAVFTVEPRVTGVPAIGYERETSPEMFSPHAGSDESGKGDYFGPLVVCCAYVDGDTAGKLLEAGAKDCKLLTAKATLETGARLRGLLGADGFATVLLRPPAYNRLYAKMRNLNRMLAWAHASALEDLLEKRPGCPRAVIDQFAPDERTVLAALKPRGGAIEIVQRHRAEDDVAVAAASVIAREMFIRETAAMGDGLPLGSSNPRIAEIAVEMVRKHGPNWIMNNCKANFKTTDAVLAACGFDRSALPPEGRVARTA